MKTSFYLLLSLSCVLTAPAYGQSSSLAATSSSFKYEEAERLFEESSVPTNKDFIEQVSKGRYAITAISGRGDYLSFGSDSGLFHDGQCSLSYLTPGRTVGQSWNRRGEFDSSMAVYQVCSDPTGHRGDPNVWEFGEVRTSLAWALAPDVEGSVSLQAVGKLHWNPQEDLTTYRYSLTRRGLELEIKLRAHPADVALSDICRLTQKGNLICKRTATRSDGTQRVGAVYLLRKLDSEGTPRQ